MSGGYGKNVLLTFTNSDFALFVFVRTLLLHKQSLGIFFLTQYKKLFKANLFQYNAINVVLSSMQK